MHLDVFGATATFWKLTRKDLLLDFSTFRDDEIIVPRYHDSICRVQLAPEILTNPFLNY